MRWSPWLASWAQYRRQLARDEHPWAGPSVDTSSVTVDATPPAAERVVDLEPALAVRIEHVVDRHSPHGRSAEVEVQAVVRHADEHGAWKAVVGRRLELVGEGLVVQVLEVREVKTTLELPDLAVLPEQYERIAGPTYWTVELRALVRTEAEVERWVRLVGATVFVELEKRCACGDDYDRGGNRFRDPTGCPLHDPELQP